MTIEELKVVLRGDASHYLTTMNDSIRLLTDFDTSAQKTAMHLESVSKAWAQPQSQESFLQNEMALQQAVADHRQQLEKQALRDRLQRMQEESQAAYELAAQQQALEERRAGETKALEAELFALTHTGYEVRLADLQRYYTTQRSLHADNAQALAVLDQVYFQRWRQLDKQKQAESALGAAQARRLTMMGVRQVGMMAGLAAPGQLGMVASMAMSGTLGVGLGLAGMTAVGMVIRSIVERTKHLKELQQEYTLQVAASEKHWRGIAQAQIETTPPGQQLQTGLEAAQQRLSEARKKLAEMAPAGVRGMEAWGTFPLKTPIGQQWQEVLQLQEAVERERQIQTQRNAQERAFAEQRAYIATRYEGDERRKVELEQELWEERVRIEQAGRDKLRLFDEAAKRGEVDPRQRGGVQWEADEALRTQAVLADSRRRQLAQQLANESAKEAQQQAQRVAQSITEMDRRMQVAGGTLSAADAAFQEQAERLQLVGEQVAKVRRQFDLLRQVEANRALIDEQRQLQIELEQTTGRITDLEAARRRMAIASSDSTPGLRDEVALLQQRVDLEKWALEQRKSIHPEIEQKEYQRRLAEALAAKAGGLTPEDAARLLERQQRGAGESLDTGEFRSIRRRFMSLEGLALGGREQDPNRENLQAIKEGVQRMVAALERGGLN